MGIECVEVVWHSVCRAVGAAGGPVVCGVLQASPHLPRVSNGIEAVHFLCILAPCCCDGFPQSVLGSIVLSPSFLNFNAMERARSLF